MAQKLYKPVLIDSILSTSSLPKQRFVAFDGSLCSAGAKAFGICDVETDQGQYAPIGVLGVFLIESGGAITKGSALTSDSQGRAVTSTSISLTSQDSAYTLNQGTAINGYALDAATAAGEVIRIVRGI